MPAKTVLLVDDDEDSRTICVTILEHHGYRVVQAADGGEGLRMARELRPDVILMDVTLPVLDGWTATSELKQSPETAEIPVIMLTARALDADRARGRDSGCDSYLTKPCSPSLVLEEVRKFAAPVDAGPNV